MLFGKRKENKNVPKFRNSIVDCRLFVMVKKQEELREPFLRLIPVLRFGPFQGYQYVLPIFSSQFHKLIMSLEVLTMCQAEI